VQREHTFFFLFFGGAALATLPGTDTLGRWHSGETSIGKCRAAEKQEEALGG